MADVPQQPRGRLNLLRGLVTAIRTLTILPIPGRDAACVASALPWFPLVGGLVGVLMVGAQLTGLRLFGPLWPGMDWPEGMAAVAVVLGVVVTRGLHLDGLADCADGFWGGRDRERTLAIMKDSRIGAFGTMALILVLLVKWVAIARLLEIGHGEWVIGACVIARFVQVDLAAGFAYARPEGGTAAAFVGGARFGHWIAALALALLLLLALSCGGCPPVAAGMLAAGWLTGRLVGLWSRRRIGGVTGDVLGGASELVEALVLAWAGAVL